MCAPHSARFSRCATNSLTVSLMIRPCIPRPGEPRRPPRPSLAEQVPALVQRDLEPPEPLTVSVGHLPVRFTLEQLVLLACKLVDPAEDLVIVHNASLLSRTDLVGTESRFRDPDPDFVQVPQQVRGVLIHAIGARPFEFILAVAPREKANAERTGAAGGEEIPDAVSHHD